MDEKKIEIEMRLNKLFLERAEIDEQLEIICIEEEAIKRYLDSIEKKEELMRRKQTNKIVEINELLDKLARLNEMEE